MGADVIMDGKVADEIADGLERVDFAGAAALDYPARSTVGALVGGASLGNSLKGSFDTLKGVVDLRADGMRGIVEAFAAADRALAEELR